MTSNEEGKKAAKDMLEQLEIEATIIRKAVKNKAKENIEHQVKLGMDRKLLKTRLEKNNKRWKEQDKTKLQMFEKSFSKIRKEKKYEKKAELVKLKQELKVLKINHKKTRKELGFPPEGWRGFPTNVVLFIQILRH